jgi:hypothetical protein
MDQATVLTLIYWLTQNMPLVIQLLMALTPIFAMALVGFVIYAVFWKADRK